MNLATGPLLGSVRAAVLTQAVLSYKSVIEVNLQPFKDNMLAAFGIPPAQEKDEALKAALGPYDPLERAKAQTVEQRALRPHILVCTATRTTISSLRATRCASTRSLRTSRRCSPCRASSTA